jgi:hypothetical protein
MLQLPVSKGEKAHPVNYRGCRHAEEMQKRKSQITTKTTTRRVFSSNLSTTGVSIEARSEAAQSNGSDLSGRTNHDGTEGPCPLTQTRTASYRSVGAPHVNSLPLDCSMLRIVTAVQQFMTEFKGAVSEEEKTVAIRKIVLNLMKQDDH